MEEMTKTTDPAEGTGQGAENTAEQTESGLLGKIKEILGFKEGNAKDENEAGKKETPGSGEPDAGTAKTKGKDPEAGTTEKTYTQADLDAAVKAAKEEIAAQQAEERRRAKLTPEQRAAEDQEAMKKQNEELKAKLNRMELEQKAAAKLEEKKLPASLAKYLDYTDESKMEASLEDFGNMYKKDLEAGIKEALKGATPKGMGSAANLTDGMISAEIQNRIRGGF